MVSSIYLLAHTSPPNCLNIDLTDCVDAPLLTYIYSLFLHCTCTSSLRQHPRFLQHQYPALHGITPKWDLHSPMLPGVLFSDIGFSSDSPP